LAEDFIENGHKVIIFSCFTNTLTEISEHFGKTKSVMIDGSVSSKNRDLAVERFQKDDKIKVFCGNIVAAGAGITLTEGTIVIFNDLDWVPANHSQATDRAYRIGQTKDVYIIYTLIDNTLDIVMFKKLQEKMKNIEIALGDNATFDKDISILNEVIKSIKD
jgi:SNF2 family DNA or RNA helicase